MSVPAPGPEDCQNLQFKTLCRLRIFASQPGLFTSSANLVSAAPLHGLIFVGTPSGFQILQSNVIGEIQAARGETSEFPHRNISLGCMPSHLSISCDQALLAVAFVQDNCPCARIYDVTSFCSRNVSVVMSVRLASSPGSKVLDLQFNPGLPLFIAACTSDGGVGVYELKGNSFEVSTLPPAVHATCLCWSPKGKQLVVGDSMGNISQYKPDLKLVKSYPPPPDKPASAIINLLWISNHQFAVIYADTSNPSERPGIMIVNVPKTGTSYINFEDICFSAGELRPPQFYLFHQAKWNLMMVASANSMEVGVLAMRPDQSWVQWTQEDASRAELPLTPSKQETYPVGLTLDTSSTRQLPWGENHSLHPMPMLHVLSNDGVLCIFHVINLMPEAVCLCEPPRPLADMSGLDQFVVAPQQQLPQPPQPAQPLPPSQPPQQQPPPPAAALPSQPMQPAQPPHSTGLFSSAPAAQQAPAPANPLAQLASITTQLQPGSKPSGFGMGGSGFGLPQIQSSFSLATTASSASPVSSFSPSQPAPLSGTSTPKTVASAFNATSLQQSQTATLPPSYSTQVQPAQQTAPAQRPSTVVPVPPVQNNVNSGPRPEESKTVAATLETLGDKAETVDPAVYMEHIQEEIKVFENEMRKLKRFVSQDLPAVGSDEEKKTILRKSEDLGSFIDELSKTVEDLKHDVHEVKSVGIEASLWVEDAKSRLKQFSKPSYLQLVKAQELDPVSARTIFNIEQKFNYVQIQLSNVNKQLSLEWGQFQDTRSPRNRLFVPTMDEIYQTMVKQRKILLTLKAILDDITQGMTAKKLRNTNRIPLISDSALAKKPAARCLQINDNTFKSDLDLSSLAENLLESQLKRQQSDDLDLELLASRALNIDVKNLPLSVPVQKRLSAKKAEKLSELLHQIPMARIKADRSPSDISSIGNRPWVSFSSSVLSISPRKSASFKTDSTPASNVPPKTAPVPSSCAAPPSTTFTALHPAATSEPSRIATPFAQSVKPSPSSPGFSAFGTASSFSFTAQTKPSPAPAAAAAAAPSEAARAAPTLAGLLSKPASPAPHSTPAPSPAAPSFSSGFNFSAPTSVSLSGAQPNTAAAAAAAAAALNLTAAAAGKSKAPPAQALAFGQTASPSFLPPSASAASVKPFSSSSPTGAPPKGVDSLSALSDMVSKTGGGAAAASPFGVAEAKAGAPPSKQPPAAFSFGGLAPAAASTPLPPKHAAPTSASPVIVIGSASSTSSSSGKAGLLPTPSVSSIQSILGGAVTITPITAASPVAAADSTTPSSSSSATSFFGGMGLGGAPIAANKPASSIFGGTGGFQATKQTTTSLFGPPPSPAATTATATSAFGKPAATTTTTSSTLFGSSSSLPAVSSATFGFGAFQASLAATPATAPASQAAASAAPTSTTTAAASSSTAAVSPATPLAISTPASSAPAVVTTSGASLLGQPPAGASSTSLFGGAASLFEAMPTSTANSSAAVATTSPAPPFAGVATSGTTTSSLFGGKAATSSAAAVAATSASLVFAAATSAASAAPTSLFGGGGASQAPAASSAASSFSFAMPASSAAATSTATATTGSTPAKQFSFALPPAAATTSASSFGGGGSVFGQPATSQTSFFGQAVCSPTTAAAPASSTAGGGLFGAAGATATSAASPFGAPSAAAAPSPFGQSAGAAGGASAFGAKPSFGQSGGSLFGQGSTFGSTSNSLFGGGSASAGSIFGGGAASPTGNSFQQQAGGVFGQPASASSSGSFSSGAGGTVEQSGFGSPSSFQSRPSGFGAFQSPQQSSGGFGAPAAFGSAPGFGSSPSFGGAPAFGSPNRVFGSPGANPGFGSTSPTQSNSTFEALATQNSGPTFGALASQDGAPTFGNMAQAPSQPSNPFGASATSTPFSNSGPSFGGSSFSSWR